MRETDRKIALVLLAAGNGNRFGGNKLLAEVEGKPMYRHLADEIEKLPGGVFFCRLAVSQYKELLTDFAGRGYHAIENRRSDLGISYSIRLALQELENHVLPGEENAAVCFAVCDQPWLRAETILKLVTEWSASGKGLGCLSCGGRDGNPAVFHLRYKNELLALTGDVGGRAVIRRHMDDLYRCEVENEKELEDIDRRSLKIFTCNNPAAPL